MLTLYTNDAPETGCVAEQGAWALGAWWTGREAWARELGGGHADPAERRGRADRPAVRDRAGPGRPSGGGALPRRAVPVPDDPARAAGARRPARRPRPVRLAGGCSRCRRATRRRCAAAGAGTGHRHGAGPRPDR